MSAIVPLLCSFLGVFAAFTLLWVYHLKTHKIAVIDLFWGPGFVLIALVHLAFAGANAVQIAFLLALTLWSMRLTAHLGTRIFHHDGDDPRYAKMTADAGPSFRMSSLWKVFWLQAVIQFAIAVPIHVLFLMPNPAGGSTVLLGLGGLMFAAGLAIEWIADTQLEAFRRTRANAGDILDRGLWAWSRHPNHFGESLLWFGLAVVVAGQTGQWWVLLAPAVLTAVMVKLSGVAMLDAHMRETKPGFDAYAARTSAFVPLPPRQQVGATSS